MAACRSTSAGADERRRWALLAVTGGWIGAALLIDSRTSGWPVGLLGALTWALLITLVVRENPARRGTVAVQVGIVVVFATAVEYVFAGWLGAYRYLDGPVPAYVPPGHGLVYLAALTFAGSAGVLAHRRAWVLFTVAAGGLLAGYGLLVVRPVDALGAFWYLCLLGFLRWGPTQLLYVGAFLVVTALEWAGTALRVWAWAPYDPVLGVIGQGNPPSVAAGGYGWFDLAAVALAPWLAGRLAAVDAAARRTLGRQPSAGLGEGTQQPAQRGDPRGIPCLVQGAPGIGVPAPPGAVGRDPGQVGEGRDEVRRGDVGQPEGANPGGVDDPAPARQGQRHRR